jgi:hypothetical protein
VHIPPQQSPSFMHASPVCTQYDAFVQRPLLPHEPEQHCASLLHGLLSERHTGLIGVQELLVVPHIWLQH